MNVMLDVKAIALWLLSATVALLVWIGKRYIDRFDDLKEKAATKDELRQLRDAIGNMLEELRKERRDNHLENSQKLDRLLEKIDDNELRASNSRHDLKDMVHALALKLERSLAEKLSKP